MRNDVLETIDGATLRKANYLLSPFAKAIVDDFTRQNRLRLHAIVFALRVFDTDVVTHSNDKCLFYIGSKSDTRAAIKTACQKAANAQFFALDLSVDMLTANICSEILRREGYMRTAVHKAFTEEFGNSCVTEIRAFWDYLGMTVDDSGFFPLPW